MGIKEITAYKGRSVGPVANSTRPSDLQSLKILLKKQNYWGLSLYDAMGPSTSHIVHNYYEIEDFMDNEGFKMACDEILKAIRMYYKTLLPYDVSLIRQYLRAVTSLYAMARCVEFVLSMYNVTDPNIPALHAGITSVSANTSENGIVVSKDIELLKGQDFDDTLRDFDFLRNRLSGLVIPKNVKELLDDWFGIAMRDQNDPAGQLYVNLIRNVTLYAVDSSGNWNPVKIVDIANVKVQDLIDNVDQLLYVTAMINADINAIAMKKHAQVLVPALLPDFKVGSVGDKREDLVNYLINSYLSTNPTNDPAIENAIMNTEYRRADIYGADNDSNDIVVAIAWAKLVDRKFIFKLIGQAMFVNADAEFAIPTNIDINTPNTGVPAGYVGPGVPLFYQVTTSYLEGKDVASKTAANTAYVCHSSITNRMSDALDITGATSIGFNVARSGSGIPFVTCSVPITGSGDRWHLLATHNGHSLELKFSYAAGSITSVKLVDVYGATVTDLYTLTTTNTNALFYVTGYDALNNRNYVGVVTNNSAVFNCSSTANDRVLLRYFKLAADWFEGECFESADFTVTQTSISYQLAMYNIGGLTYFLQNVDFHIPFWFRPSLTFQENGTTLVKFQQPTQLLKECYTTKFFAADTVRESLRYSMLGLFASGGYNYVVSERMDKDNKSYRKNRNH